MGIAVLFLPVWIWICESRLSFGSDMRIDSIGFTVCSPQLPNKNVIPWGGYLVRIPSLPITWTSKVLLPQRDRVLHPRNIHFNRRGKEERSYPDDVTPLRRDRSHVPLLRLELYQGRMSHYGLNGCVRCSPSGTFSVHVCALFAVIFLLLSDARAAIQLAKMTKYMGGTLSCDILFGLFMVSWLITRHILFILVIMTTYADLPRYVLFKWDPASGYYITNNIYINFLVLMGLLQVRSISSLCYASRLTGVLALGASTDLVLYDIESRT